MPFADGYPIYTDLYRYAQTIQQGAPVRCANACRILVNNVAFFRNNDIDSYWVAISQE